ncbi:MAG TPA: hypothetical protein VFF70_05430 [Anaerolineae bacterium]|nr:hypothetical protein [Anaerolineae bacterium]
MNLLVMLAVVLTACGQPSAPVVMTPIELPTVVLPPTRTPTPTLAVEHAVRTVEPTAVPSIAATAALTIARTIVPPATPAASIVYTSTDAIFTLQFPANWAKQSGERQLLTSQLQHMAYVWFSAPGTPPQPAMIIFYNWPAVDVISNDTAWQQAFALASLAIKNCAMNLGSNTSAPIDIAGEHAQFIGYTDACGEQGELIGLVHHGLNAGILIEAPQSLWREWRPILRGIIGSLTLN